MNRYRDGQVSRDNFTNCHFFRLMYVVKQQLTSEFVHHSIQTTLTDQRDFWLELARVYCVQCTVIQIAMVTICRSTMRLTDSWFVRGITYIWSTFQILRHRYSVKIPRDCTFAIILRVYFSLPVEMRADAFIIWWARRRWKYLGRSWSIAAVGSFVISYRWTALFGIRAVQWKVTVCTITSAVFCSIGFRQYWSIVCCSVWDIRQCKCSF